MKRLITIFAVIALFVSALSAQNCNLKVKFEIIPATCYNNGKVAYALVNDADEVYNTIPSNLSQVRIYYKVNEEDSAHYHAPSTGGWDTLVVDYGTYIVGVEALCNNGGGYTKVDTHTVITIPTTYTKPSASALYVTATQLTDYGKHPTLNCMESGRIQLKIEDGRFPYTVTVKRHGASEVYRTLVFDTNQYKGTNDKLYNYKDYYTIENMPEGDWDFYVVDGCEYGLPRTGQHVNVIGFPKLDYVEIYASSGNFIDFNVVKINAVLDEDYAYYSELLPQFAEYRFTYGDAFPASEWRPFPIIENYRTTLYDTVNTDKYCDLRGKNITLEFKLTHCSDTTIYRTFQYNKPNPNYFETDHSDIRDSNKTSGDPCVDLWYYHTRMYSIRYYSDLFYYGTYNPSYANRDNDHPYYRYHYTHPLTWIYTDKNTNQIIKRDTVSNISTWSYLYDTDITASYGSFFGNTLKLPIERKLVDAKGCEQFITFDTLLFKYDTGSQVTSWKIENSTSEHCCKDKRWVKVYEHYHSDADPDGTIVRLVRSPYNNRYNFEAVYSSATHRWTVTKSSLENVADVVGENDGLSLLLSDYCLPSGPYEFDVITACDSFRLKKNVGFQDIYSTEMTQTPVFTYHQQCTDRYITYTAGQFTLVSRNTSTTTGLELPPNYTALPTYFQIVSGPTGGYDGYQHSVNQDIRISMPGTYVVRIAPSSNLNLCDIPAYYDTIVYDGSTVEFVYAYALLCDSNSTEGTVFVKAGNGTEPYTYTLYPESNKQGTAIASNSVGTFENVPMSYEHIFSCMVQDACNSYFHVNINPRTLQDMQKIWFDGGMKVKESCEGDSVSINALEIGNIIQYDWTGPGGFTSDESKPYIFIPRGSPSGWYKVTITVPGCTGTISDSVYLTVNASPSLTIQQDALVCPGEEVELTFTPSSPIAGDDVEFTIAFANGNGVETRTYTAHSGSTVTDIYSTLTDAKIYPIGIKDTRCEYIHADHGDTIYITTRTDIVNACTILTTHDTACFGGDARLTAKSTMEPPYSLRWYADDALDHLLKEEEMTDSDAWSYYDTLGITKRTVLFVSIEKESMCPTIYGVPTNTMNMQSGSTTLECGQTLRLFDSGGPDGSTQLGEMTLHTFSTTDGKPVVLQFDELNLSKTAHLFVISGSEPLVDSILYDLTSISENPGLITSNGDKLTLYFIGGMVASDGWSARVEHAGVAIADVWKKNAVILRDDVCQSQSNSYDDPYGVIPAIATRTQLNLAMRRAGTYIYEKTLEGADSRGCDSTVTFILTVNAPPYRDTTVVTTNLNGGSYTWHGKTYTATGKYAFRTSLPDGCDSLDVLNLIILEVDTTVNDLCEGDTTVMGITVKEPEMATNDNLIPPTINVGDIFCTDGSILNVDSFINSGKTAKGIIYYVDNTGMHGLMTALAETQLIWVREAVENSVHALTYYPHDPNLVVPSFDMNGLGNTMEIKRTAELADGNDFATNAPAAHFCYYYDHNTRTVGETPQGWYLPSFGELGLLNANRVYVNNTLNKLRNAGFATTLSFGNSMGYWASTETDYRFYYNNTLVFQRYYLYTFYGDYMSEFSIRYAPRGVCPVTSF